MPRELGHKREDWRRFQSSSVSMVWLLGRRTRGGREDSEERFRGIAVKITTFNE